MTLDELAASWDEKAAHWRRTAKQQRSACRTGDSTKVRLLEKAQLAEDCATELRAAIAKATNLFGGALRGNTPHLVIVDDIQQDTPNLKARAKARTQALAAGARSMAESADDALGKMQFQQLAEELDREARESTVDSGGLQGEQDGTKPHFLSGMTVGQPRPLTDAEQEKFGVEDIPSLPLHKGGDSE